MFIHWGGRKPFWKIMPLSGEEIYRIALRVVPKTVNDWTSIPPWVIPFAREIERLSGLERASIDAKRNYPELGDKRFAP